MQHTHYPLLIIGGGPIGLACAIEAKKAGIGYCIIEKGCLVNSLYHYPVNMTFFSTSERLEIGGVPFVSNNPKPTRAEALEYYRRVALSYELRIHLFEEVMAFINMKQPRSTGLVSKPAVKLIRPTISSLQRAFMIYRINSMCRVKICLK